MRFCYRQGCIPRQTHKPWQFHYAVGSSVWRESDSGRSTTLRTEHTPYICILAFDPRDLPRYDDRTARCRFANGSLLKSTFSAAAAAAAAAVESEMARVAALEGFDPVIFRNQALIVYQVPAPCLFARSGLPEFLSSVLFYLLPAVFSLSSKTHILDLSRGQQCRAM